MFLRNLQGAQVLDRFEVVQHERAGPLSAREGGQHAADALADIRLRLDFPEKRRLLPAVEGFGAKRLVDAVEIERSPKADQPGIRPALQEKAREEAGKARLPDSARTGEGQDADLAFQERAQVAAHHRSAADERRPGRHADGAVSQEFRGVVEPLDRFPWEGSIDAGAVSRPVQQHGQ